MNNNTLTSIVILSYNTLDMLKMCIESIKGFTEPSEYEIIVVENASSDGSAEWLKEQKDIRCIFNSENMGFPKGCNQGMKIAKGDDILLLNSDIIVTPRWLEQLKTALYSDKKNGAVSCLANKCSNLQQLNVTYDGIDELLVFAENYNHSNSQKWIPYMTLVGFCFLFKREVYEKIGDLDEEFSPGNYEDDDYSFRIRKEGYRLLMCADTFIHHFGSGSFIKKRTAEEEKAHGEKYNALLERNRKYFCNKWHVPINYKKVSMPVEDIVKYASNNEHVLIVGNYCMQDISKLFILNNNLKIDYLTDNEIENQLIHGDYKLFYNKSILQAAKQITDMYDLIVVSDKIKNNANKKKLLNLIFPHAQNGKMMVQG